MAERELRQAEGRPSPPPEVAAAMLEAEKKAAAEEAAAAASDPAVANAERWVSKPAAQSRMGRLRILGSALLLAWQDDHCS